MKNFFDRRKFRRLGLCIVCVDESASFDAACVDLFAAMVAVCADGSIKPAGRTGGVLAAGRDQA